MELMVIINTAIKNAKIQSQLPLGIQTLYTMAKFSKKYYIRQCHNLVLFQLILHFVQAKNGGNAGCDSSIEVF